MTEDADFFWLVGLLEGEGAFMALRRKGRTVIDLVVALKMTDADVMRKASKIMGRGGTINEDKKIRPRCKQCFAVRLVGYRAERLMGQILPYMGERRKQQINEAIARWESRPRKSRERFMPVTCHPGRKHMGRGLCSSCYQKQYKKELVERFLAGEKDIPLLPYVKQWAAAHQKMGRDRHWPCPNQQQFLGTELPPLLRRAASP